MLLTGGRVASAQTQAPATYCGEFASDFKYLVNNTADDAIDVVTAPLHIEQAGELLRSPQFYLVLGGAGALWGGSFALDQTMRSHLRSMSSSDADLLQNVSYGSVAGATALLYGYGLYENDSRAREDALTAGMGAGHRDATRYRDQGRVRALAPITEQQPHRIFSWWPIVRVGRCDADVRVGGGSERILP